jgi:hypothetical protein
MFTVRVTALDAENQAVSEKAIQVEVVNDSVVTITRTEAQQAVTAPSGQAEAFQSPTATPLPQPQPSPTAVTQSESANIQVVSVTPEVAAAAPPPTPILIFPPPPPAPGVPPGPIQEQLPELTPPKCDAAKYLGPFVPSTRERITITEPDPVPAKTVGGTLVHRAWRLQNIGTCTWGPGYELAFYGGRAMGSGGVTFEATYPSEPARRNTVSNSDRLIVPEGKPNQVAVLEVLLQTPVTPGIHQSYWRMINPHGVPFGPIIGVTMEIVRECEFGIYGAPVINKFEILGVGDVFQPDNPVEVTAEVGQPVVLEWSIINAENYDIVITDPVGNTTNLATSSPTDRSSFVPTRVGEYTITLYADNGSCTASATVIVNAIPPEGEQFNLIIITGNPAAAGVGAGLQFSSAISPTSIGAEWTHFDSGVDEVLLYSSIYERKVEAECSVVIAGNAVLCSEPGWRLLQTIEQSVGDNSGAAIVTNVKAALARFVTDPNAEYQFRYVAQANKAGSLEQQEPCSNTVVESAPLLTLPTEISPDQADASSSGSQAQPAVTSPCVTAETVAAATSSSSSSSSPFVLFSSAELAEGSCVLTIGDMCLNWPEIVIGGLAILIFIWIIRAIFR